MPRRRQPARLWLRPATRTRDAAWFIVDGGRQYGTGCGPAAREEAERKLADYIGARHDPTARRARHPDKVPLADVLSVYLDEIGATQAQPAKVAARVGQLLDWWGGRMLSDVGPQTCREYAASRKRGGSRRDLEDLRAAVNYHAKRGLHVGYVPIELPTKGNARTTWLTRDDVAKLLWVCWRHGRTVRLPRGREKGQIVESEFHDLRHIARFILLAVYTGSRSGACFTASIYAGADRSFLDLDSGIFYRLAKGAHETAKRQPPVPIPPRLMPHLRRWRDKGIIAQYVVEWQGAPVQSVKVGWKRALELAGLQDRGIVPHTLRHTAATWLMKNGASTSDVSRYLGMSEPMVTRVYAHHHPEFLRDAARRIGRQGSYRGQ